MKLQGRLGFIGVILQLIILDTIVDKYFVSVKYVHEIELKVGVWGEANIKSRSF